MSEIQRRSQIQALEQTEDRRKSMKIISQKKSTLLVSTYFAWQVLAACLPSAITADVADAGSSSGSWAPVEQQVGHESRSKHTEFDNTVCMYTHCKYKDI